MQNTREVLNPKKKATAKGFHSQSLGPAKPKQESYVMRMSWFRTASMSGSAVCVLLQQKLHTKLSVTFSSRI